MGRYDRITLSLLPLITISPAGFPLAILHVQSWPLPNKRVPSASRYQRSARITALSLLKPSHPRVAVGARVALAVAISLTCHRVW